MGSLIRRLRRDLFLAELEQKRAVVQLLIAMIASHGPDTSQDTITAGFRNYLEEVEGFFEEARRMKTLEEEQFLENLRGVVADSCARVSKCLPIGIFALRLIR